jgi:hypothetical protein
VRAKRNQAIENQDSSAALDARTCPPPGVSACEQTTTWFEVSTLKSSLLFYRENRWVPVAQFALVCRTVHN